MYRNATGLIAAGRGRPRCFLITAATLLLASCGPTPPAQTSTVGGTVTGLAGTGLVLQNNLADDLPVNSNGTFSFPTKLASGAEYIVTVKMQPRGPTQTCQVLDYTGTVAAADITSVSVTCATNMYPISGTASGLTGTGLVLQNNAADDLAVAATGAFTFTNPVASGAPYNVTVKTQPTSPNQLCTVTNATGTVGANAITNTSVICANSYSVAGTISGYTGGGLTLSAPGMPDLPVPEGATSFIFPPLLTTGSIYAVIVRTPPPATRCNAAGGVGVVAETDATGVSIHCSRIWTYISAEAFHTMATTSDGTLWAWGDNSSGQLGDGTTTDRLTPVQIGSGYTAVAGGYGHTIAVKTDGTLWAWGDNISGQLGDGTTTDRLTPVQIGVEYAAGSAGRDHTLAVKTDGTLWAWGSNRFGQLGDGTTTNRLSPVQVGSGFASVAAGSNHTLAVKTDGTLWAWGYNYNGQLGDGTTTDRLAPVQVGNGYAAVSAGGYYSPPDGAHSLALQADGTLWAWGANGAGELGDGTGTNRRTPTEIP